MHALSHASSENDNIHRQPLRTMQNFITPLRSTLLKRLSLGLIASLMIVMLTACSLARLGYSNGETISYWWLNGYVGFDADQKIWVRQHIDKLFVWHRRNELKQYVQLLTAAQHRLQHDIIKAEVLADYEELTQCGDRALDVAAPDLADLALSMNADNMARLQQKFDSNNETFRKDYLRGDKQEQQEYRYKLVMEWAEYWFGNFSLEQEAVIRRASDARPLNNEMWATDRVQRQQALMALLKRIHAEKPSREAVTEMIKTYVSNSYLLRTGATPEMKVFFEASKDSVAQLAVVIVNITTPKQRTHATEKLQQWIDDFTALAKTG